MNRKQHTGEIQYFYTSYELLLCVLLAVVLAFKSENILKLETFFLQPVIFSKKQL